MRKSGVLLHISSLPSPYGIGTMGKEAYKFVDFLMFSTESGYFETQMNVTSSKLLIEAKKNPKKFPNLIVRVWGFSAYFNDLPEEYKNVLIERALKSEGKK